MSPWGVPRTYSERRAQHLGRFGTMENFPEIRMGAGIPRDYSERRDRHLRNFGTMDNFPEMPRGRFGGGLDTGGLLSARNILLGGAGLLFLHLLTKK